MSGAATTTPTSLPIDSVGVEEGLNPRQRFDEAEMAELVASVESNGVVQPITVRADGDKYVVVAGHRRLEAAKQAGLEEIPVHVREEDGSLSASIAENLIRSDLDPVEEGFALQRLGQQEGLNQGKLAKRVGKSPSWVAERMRLVKLPPACRDQIATGALPLAAEKPLRAIAKVSEVVADYAANFAAERQAGNRLLDDTGQLLWQVAHHRSEGETPPPLYDIDRESLPVDVVAEADRSEVIARYLDALPALGYGYVPDVEDLSEIPIEETAIDAARAAGCLLEFGEEDGWRGYAFLTDRAFAADLVVRYIEALEKEADKQRKEATKAAEAAGDEAPADPGDQSAEDRALVAKEQRRKEREKAVKAKAKAEQRNEKLGVELLNRRGAQSRKDHSLNRAKVLAKLVLAQNGELAGAGLRYVLPALSEVEKTTLKSGAERSKIVYRDQAECADYLARKVEECKTPQEVLELMSDALVAALWADEDAIAMSNRIGWYPPSGDIAKDLKDEAAVVGAKGGPRKRSWLY